MFYMGCQEPINYLDRTPPDAPTGVYVENGDNAAYISWNQNYERDVAGYNIYSSSSYNGKYYLIGTTKSTSFTDYDITNGYKYYYAITAYDYDNNESGLSYEEAYAAPRPEGFNQSIFDYHQFPSLSAFSFATESVVNDTSALADFYFNNDNGAYYLDVFSDTDIKDMGMTNSIYDITTAPSAGWTKYATASVGHTYVIWTVDNNYAKIRISSVNSQRIVFDWAYQTIKGEVTMKTTAKTGGHTKVVHTRASVQ
jgi:sensor histidine kinase YesM